MNPVTFPKVIHLFQQVVETDELHRILGTVFLWDSIDPQRELKAWEFGALILHYTLKSKTHVAEQLLMILLRELIKDKRFQEACTGFASAVDEDKRFKGFRVSIYDDAYSAWTGAEIYLDLRSGMRTTKALHKGFSWAFVVELAMLFFRAVTMIEPPEEDPPSDDDINRAESFESHVGERSDVRNESPDNPD